MGSKKKKNKFVQKFNIFFSPLLGPFVTSPDDPNWINQYNLRYIKGLWDQNQNFKFAFSQ